MIDFKIFGHTYMILKIGVCSISFGFEIIHWFKKPYEAQVV